MADDPTTAADPASQPEDDTPLDALGTLAMQTVPISEHLDHLELYTSRGLLSVLWHGPADASAVVVCVGGAMGGLLGPDGGLYHRVGVGLAEQGIGVLRVSYRRPNDMAMCVHDTLAAMELAARHGALRFAVLGHSFGGAVAIQAACHLDVQSVPGVVTFATQSAGCEMAERLHDRDLLFVHGTNDQILPHQSSEMVRMLAGTGELWLLPGVDHLMSPAGDELYERMMTHLPALLAEPESQTLEAQDA